MPDGLFSGGDVIRRVDGEALLLLGGGRALLMQLAHPAVAAAVDEHSDFRNDAFGRLRRTLEVTTAIVFGTAAEARQAAEGVAAVHRRVRGDGYEADDPDLLLWVHATLVDTALRIHRRFLRPLSAAEVDRYYAQSMVLAEVLGVPLDRQPPDVPAFAAYVRGMVGTLEVSDQARTVAGAVLHQRVPLVVQPLAELARQITVGLLPPPLRRQYGFSWDPAREMALQAAGLAARTVLPRVPRLRLSR